MDFENLIGLDEQTARKILQENGYNNITTILNSKENEKCNTTLVCAVKNFGENITLICGEFYII